MKRTLTSIAILLVVGGMIALREVHTAFFDVFVLLLMIIAGAEFIGVYKKSNKPIFERLVIFYPLPVAAAYIFCQSLVSVLMIQICTFIVIFLVAMGIELIVHGINYKTGGVAPQTDMLLATTKNTIWVMFYPLTIISFMFTLNHFGNLDMGYIVLVVMFAVSMLTDTMAYLIGIMFGKKSGKMAPYISPNKSIAGMIGGVVGGLVGSMLCFVLFYTLNLLPNSGITTALSTVNAVALFSMVGILGSFATQFGDLVESAVKRKAGIKDIGKILPGHGGIMDRIDGEIFCSVIVVVMFSLFKML